jgi:hypothetical protein
VSSAILHRTGEFERRAQKRCFPIANADFPYVLSTFAFEPIRLNARFGWRRRVEAERPPPRPVLGSAPSSTRKGGSR